MNLDDLARRGPKVATGMPRAEFRPSFKLIAPDQYELMSLTEDEAEAIKELESLGVKVPEGVVPRIVEAKHDPAGWGRDAMFVKHPGTGKMVKTPATSRNVIRRRWVFDFKAVPTKDVAALVKHVLKRKAKPRKEADGGAYVVALADLQVGKTGPDGGTKDLLDALGDKLESVIREARAGDYSEIVLADLGDGCENIENVDQQAHTNDLSFTDQLDLFNAITLRACLDLADIAPVRYVAIPSNHMQLRKDKQRIGIARDDFGILNARTLHRTLDTASRDDIQVIIPAAHDETLAIDIAGLPVGFAHGHQVARPDRISEWWAKQAFGDQPLGAARLLLTGHFHHLRVQQMGKGRTWIQAPTMDAGSAWFTSISGEVSQRGILTLSIADGAWDNLRIH